MNAAELVDREVSEHSAGVALEPFKTWMCVLCAWVYDEQQGDPASGIVAGTRWDDIPQDWLCPDCGVGKSEFTLVEV